LTIYTGNVSQVIRELGMARRTFYGKIKKAGHTILKLRKEAGISIF
jgi:transcriptional regulator of acetoin/glycerol metabolism